MKKTFGLKKVDPEAASLLLARYGKDNKVSANEFNNLFNGINGLHKEFLDADFKKDANGYLDASELANAFKKHGHADLSPDFFTWLIVELEGRDNNKPGSGLQFDKYIRVAERFDQLAGQFKKNGGESLEKYARDNFFN